jgi:hypothetical protein
MYPQEQKVRTLVAFGAIWGHICEFHWTGGIAPGCSETPLQGCVVRGLQHPGILGVKLEKFPSHNCEREEPGQQRGKYVLRRQRQLWNQDRGESKKLQAAKRQLRRVGSSFNYKCSEFSTGLLLLWLWELIQYSWLGPEDLVSHIVLGQ